MIPKVAACVARGARRRRRRPHPRRPASPRAAARAVHRRRHRHHGHADRRVTVTRRHRTCPLMPTYAAAAGHVRAGRGHRALGRRRQGATSTSSPASRSPRSATPTRRWPTPSPSRPARCCTSPTSSAPSSGPRWRRTLDRLLGGGGQVFFCNSRRRGQRVRHQAGPQVGRPRPPRRRQRLRLVPRPHAGHAARHRPAGQKHEAFQPLPEGFRHVAWDDLDALEARHRPDRSPPCCSSPCRARAACNPATRRVLPGRAPAVRRAGRAVHGRRGADRPRPHRRVVRLPALRRRARRRHHGQGARQRRADRRVLGPGRRGRRLRARRPRHDLRRPAPGHRRGPGRARRDGGRGRPGPGRARPAPADRRPARRCPASPRVRGLGLLLAAELADGIDAKAVAADALDAGPRRQRGHARPRCGSPRRCSSPTTRSTRRVAILAKVAGGDA